MLTIYLFSFLLPPLNTSPIFLTHPCTQNWLLNVMVYGHLFPNASDEELASLRLLGERWKAYVKASTWIYEEHSFWVTGSTFWELKKESPDLFLHLSESDLVSTSNVPLVRDSSLAFFSPSRALALTSRSSTVFKGDLNHRCVAFFPSPLPPPSLCLSHFLLYSLLTSIFHSKLTYDCHAPPSTPFDVAIGPLATDAGTPPVLSLRTIKSDVVVGIPSEKAAQLDRDEPGWKIRCVFFYSFPPLPSQCPPSPWIEHSANSISSYSGAYAIILFSEGRKGEEVEF
jgi:hypothetical protein